MAGEYPARYLGEVVTNFDARRVPLSSREREKRRGPYPYHGATGVMDHVDDFLFNGLHLLVAEDGSVETPEGKPFLQLVDSKFWVSNHAHVLKGATDEETKFLYYALSTIAIRPFISGSVQAKLSQHNMNQIAIPYPPDNRTRRTIAHILGTLDDKIELNRRMNETLEAMARAIFKSWFVDFDPVRAKADGRDPSVPPHIANLFPNRFEDSELGEIPAGWGIQGFTDAVEIIGGGTPQTSVGEYWNGNIPWFSVVDAPTGSDVWVVDTEKKITREGVENSSTRVLPVGTTIISARGTVGRIALVGVPMAMNQSCYGLRGKTGTQGFFTYFTTQELVASLQQHAHGSVFDTITRDTLAGISVATPPTALIEAFESRVSPILERIRMALAESRTLAALRDALLPKLLSGEIRVKDAEKFVEARA